MTEPFEPVPWWRAEPSRLGRDRREIGEAFPDLALDLDGEGRWQGTLPLWPFDRPVPADLDVLTGGRGLVMRLDYLPAYPVVSPWITPVDPEPLVGEWTQTPYHVLGNGALCLFQTQADWDPCSSVVELLMKAAGWRIEYALLKAGACDEMTKAGIVHDDSLDVLITRTAALALPSGTVVREGALPEAVAPA